MFTPIVVIQSGYIAEEYLQWAAYALLRTALTTHKSPLLLRMIREDAVTVELLRLLGTVEGVKLQTLHDGQFDTRRQLTQSVMCPQLFSLSETSETVLSLDSILSDTDNAQLNEIRDDNAEVLQQAVGRYYGNTEYEDILILVTAMLVGNRFTNQANTVIFLHGDDPIYDAWRHVGIAYADSMLRHVLNITEGSTHTINVEREVKDELNVRRVDGRVNVMNVTHAHKILRRPTTVARLSELSGSVKYPPERPPAATIRETLRAVNLPTC